MNSGQMTNDGGMNNPNQTTAGSNAGQTMNGTSNQSTNGMNNQAGNAITDTSVYASTADKLSLAGKNAQFSNARVVRVVGPRTFTVASGKDEIYVMLDDASARAVGTQGKIDADDTVNITGSFARLEMAEINDIKSNRFRPLTDAERAFLKKTAVYLQANQVSGSK